jgi:hypothetical protein
MVEIQKLLTLLSEIEDTHDNKTMNTKILELNSILLESDEETGIEELDDFLLDLGMDLEHFVSNPIHRSQSNSYFGPKELKVKITEAMNRIKEFLYTSMLLVITPTAAWGNEQAFL